MIIDLTSGFQYGSENELKLKYYLNTPIKNKKIL